MPIASRWTVIACIAFTTVAAAQERNDEPQVEIVGRYVDEITALKNDDRVQQAMQHIVTIEPQSRRDLIELTEIPAPPFKEDERAARFAEMLREAGLSDVWIDEVGNAIGRRPGRACDGGEYSARVQSFGCLGRPEQPGPQGYVVGLGEAHHAHR